jgi:hypothetical protein
MTDVLCQLFLVDQYRAGDIGHSMIRLFLRLDNSHFESKITPYG